LCLKPCEGPVAENLRLSTLCTTFARFTYALMGLCQRFQVEVIAQQPVGIG